MKYGGFSYREVLDLRFLASSCRVAACLLARGGAGSVRCASGAEIGSGVGGSDLLLCGCSGGSDGCRAWPELMVEGVLQAGQCADVRQDLSVEDPGDGGVRDGGRVGQSAE